ncbi:hypothetical protein [Litchfieldia salsa]|uniref:Uncharacterized protein n=1 Tax=Litchfieldia salsa TaxID=930152 RepID=A0A1H0Q3N5_9BACI|nr:hypothetical protein [Litchfieldia salsa]SDP11316.1 hypothetical protein SAMN05216565_101559 [Litchfieldia salsa]
MVDQRIVDSNEFYSLIDNLDMYKSEISFENIPDLKLKIKIGKRVYLFNKTFIINTLEENLSYTEKVLFLKDIDLIKERNSNISNYLKTFLTGVTVRKEALRDGYKRAL